MHMYTGNLYKAMPRLQECCRQVEAEEVSNSRNKIHPTWERPYRDSLDNNTYLITIATAVIKVLGENVQLSLDYPIKLPT